MSPPHDEQDEQAEALLGRRDSPKANGRTTSNSNTKTQVVTATVNGVTIPYVRCESTEAFVDPTMTTTSQDVLQTLNLDLGQTFLTRDDCQCILWMIQFLDRLLVQWWESIFFAFWKNCIPLSWKRALTFGSWKVYLEFHKRIFGRATGMHPSQSLEYHALTTLLWWGRFFPSTPRRMRFSLSQLHACTPNTVQAYKVETIQQDCINNTRSVVVPPSKQQAHTTVRGLYLQQSKTPSDAVLFWIYGGAYLAGDCQGNSSAADWVGRHAGMMDVFIPEFRLAPEADLDDVLWDVALAYKWLTTTTTTTTIKSKKQQKIYLFGVSSGAAIGVRLMQMIVQQRQQQQQQPDKNNKKQKLLAVPCYITDLVHDVSMPQAAVLLGPYVDYTDPPPPNGSFSLYPRLDLVVNESVQDYGLPYLNTFLPLEVEGHSYHPKNRTRHDCSPVYQSLKGLPPLCVVVSEHEAVYDMTMDLVNKARSDGVAVTVGVWKYMCHVFTLLWGLCPEGKASMDFVCEWLRQQQEQQQQQSGEGGSGGENED